MADGLKNNRRWVYYNRAVVCESNPNDEIMLDTAEQEALFSKYPKAFFIRYTCNCNLPFETQWWHCIKDSEFSLEALPSKKRNVVRNGKKNFDVRIINPCEYVDAFYEVINDANLGYAKPVAVTMADIQNKCNYLSKRSEAMVFGAFDKETQKLCGYLWVDDFGSYMNMVEQKAMREFERRQINAALMCALCEWCNPRFKDGFIISDGQRNIVHKTNFQDYLIKYFGFKRAYCKLSVIYSKSFKPLVVLAFPFRKPIAFLASKTNNKFLQNISGIMLMENVLRWQKHEKI